MYKFDRHQIQVGISACLLGQKVRFDGGHKQSRFCQDDLGQHVHFRAICPEVAIGMGTPRQTIRLVAADKVRVKASDGSFDVTEPLTEFSRSTSATLGYLSGYVFCAKSPTCGMERVSLYQPDSNNSVREGIGVFARRIMIDHPNLPVEENGRLNDHNLRENFVTRVFAYHDWQQLRHQGLSADALYRFHARYKYLLMAHDLQVYKTLGRELADAGSDLAPFANRYESQFMGALKQHANRKAHTNVLQHIQGYLKRELSSKERVALAECIDKYRRGLLPLLAPISLLKHYMTLYPNSYISDQVYLNPHPEEMQLRYEH
ncbi:Uncharacterized conserved protein YbgA, DUF1722 family [Ferrimonas sediminum]|uniref:Uncharacterized conserved protein YbgA, DUF1722 family n=1 Tax=Ferrimonas sediminum TaxID=718193 RepID=A0A1G8VJ90_9GAMM|nr:DUF523 and DUF1722 domain-containing protein [Ferrimonas sediminum]SDJ66118.1 Uncharacterized conserved protein YbgA, DUF1722 family [Ferrimonas sediminum]